MQYSSPAHFVCRSHGSVGTPSFVSAIAPEVLAGVVAVVDGIAGTTGVVRAAGMLGVAAEGDMAGIAGAAPPPAAPPFELLLFGSDESGTVGALADVGALDAAACDAEGWLLAAGDSVVGIGLSPPQPVATKKQRL